MIFLRLDLYENKITLKKIKNIICPEMEDVEFLNKIFSPLAKEGMTFYKSYSIEKHKSFFINGNITKNYCKSSESYATKQRDKTRDLNYWAELLLCDTAFNEMIEIIKKITENSSLNRHHEIFSLIELDIDAMPDPFTNFLNVCLEENKCAEVLLMMILWSIYGECIVYIEDIYAISKKSEHNLLKKDVRLVSHIKSCRPVFMGRDSVIDDIHEYFISGNHFIFLKGMGGIGKSECAKQYAETYKSEYNTIVFAECTDSLVNLINDNSVFTLTVPFVSEQMPNESDEDFFCRKIAKIKEIADDKTLVIIDNLDFISMEIENLITLPLRFIVTTRCDYSAIYQQQTKLIEEITDKTVLRDIFAAYYGKDINDFIYTDRIIEMFCGHTMAIELIAKQMRSACMTPKEMFDILSKSEEDEFEEKFIMPNHSKEYQTLSQHMLTLFNVSALDDEEKYILMCLSLMPLSGINKRSFKQSCSLKNFNSINKLVERSWISESYDRIYLHTLIKETVLISCKPDLIKCKNFIDGLMKEYSSAECYYGTYDYKKEIQKIVMHLYNTFSEPTADLWEFYEWLDLHLSHFNYHHISLPITEKLYDIYKAVYGENHFRTARMLVRMGCAKRRYGDVEEAIYLMEQGRKMILELKSRSERETLYISDTNFAITGALLANYDLCDNTELSDKVENLCLEAISICKSLKGVFSPLMVNTAPFYSNLAWLEIYRNDHKKASYYLEIANNENSNMRYNYTYYLAEYIRGKLAVERGSIDEAVKHMKDALRIWAEFFGEYDIILIRVRTELGDIYLKLDDTPSALAQYRTALEHLEKMPFKNKKLYDKILQKIQTIEDK